MTKTRLNLLLNLQIMFIVYDAIGTNLHSDENDSIGGYIIEQLDRFPKRGDRLKTGNIEFIIEHATKARIVSIIMKIKQS